MDPSAVWAGRASTARDARELEVLKLVRRLRGGLERAETTAALDAHLRPRLRRYFLAARFDPAEADDLVQSVLVRVFQGMDGLRAEESFVPWLFVIAHNVARTAIAHRQREREVIVGSLEAVPEQAAPHTAPPPTDEMAAVWNATAALPPQQRQCLVLRVRDELSYREIATLLRLSPRTVRNHLAEARRSLRRMLRPQEAGEERL